MMASGILAGGHHFFKDCLGLIFPLMVPFSTKVSKLARAVGETRQ